MKFLFALKILEHHSFCGGEQKCFLFGTQIFMDFTRSPKGWCFSKLSLRIFGEFFLDL
jgi:hypothetical protein